MRRLRGCRKLCFAILATVATTVLNPIPTSTPFIVPVSRRADRPHGAERPTPISPYPSPKARRAARSNSYGSVAGSFEAPST